jgi:ABC-type glycerol-3-phosphate transport system substrate-binding protein
MLVQIMNPHLNDAVAGKITWDEAVQRIRQEAEPFLMSHAASKQQ